MSAASPPRGLPPVDLLGMASLVLVIVGGIVMAASLPPPVDPALPVILLVAAVLLTLAAAVLLVRIPAFAWGVFRRVAAWSLLAYVVIAGMLAYTFIHDGTRGADLAVLLAMLLMFALDVPLLLGFGVARYQPPDAPAAA